MRWFYQKEDNDNIPFIVKIPFFKAGYTSCLVKLRLISICILEIILNFN